ncbi:hypothetical protein [Burkholderia stagnalis]|uniref:hypothetical protein n=1 Tax=Burkholderia stagnalis TaxID=1503054 RepID=UPI000B3202EF|nr:hypothetical protein [Burkholderia stagnalis]
MAMTYRQAVRSMMLERIDEYRACRDQHLTFAWCSLGRDIAADVFDLGGMAGAW